MQKVGEDWTTSLSLLLGSDTQVMENPIHKQQFEIEISSELRRARKSAESHEWIEIYAVEF